MCEYNAYKVAWEARQSVSRVLSFKLVIYLGLSSHLNSSNQPWWLTKNCFRPSIVDLAISIWSCSRWGFPCVFCYQKTGVLLPHLFTLALIRRFIFCGTIPEVSLARSYLAPCSYRARTFLFHVIWIKVTNQLSGRNFIMQKKTLNQEFFYSLFAKFCAIIKHSWSSIPLISSFLKCLWKALIILIKKILFLVGKQ